MRYQYQLDHTVTNVAMARMPMWGLNSYARLGLSQTALG